MTRQIGTPTTGVAYRTAANEIFSSLYSVGGNDADPGTTVANEWKVDTTTFAGQRWLKVRNSANSAWEFIAQVSANFGLDYPAGSPEGLALSNNSGTPATNIDIAAGRAMLTIGNRGLAILGATMVKQLHNTWAAGTNLGGRFSGVSLADGWYHVFLIRNNTTGAVDAGFDTSISAANRPSGWSARRIGSIFRISSSIRLFTQTGDFFRWERPCQDIIYRGSAFTTGVNGSTPGLTAGEPIGLCVPPGVKIMSRLALIHNFLATVGTDIWVSAMSDVNLAPDFPLGRWTMNLTTSVLTILEIETDTSQQIRVRWTGTPTPLTAGMQFNQYGYTDPRI